MNIEKKRDLLPLLKKAIGDLTDLSGDLAGLEYKDNDQASRRVKRDLTAFKAGSLEELTRAVFKTREEIRNK